MYKYLIPSLIILIPLFVYQFKKYLNGPMCKFKPNLKDKIIIITGATGLLGKQTALKLAELGATIVLASRNQNQQLIDIKEIQQKTNNPNLHFIRLDLEDFDQILEFVQEFKKKFNKLDILINNAGNQFATKQVNKNGIELTLAINHFGHFLLTYHLLDYLKKTEQSRVIVLSSVIHYVGNIDYYELEKKLQSRTQYHHYKIYADSKLYNIQFASYLQTLLDENNIKCKTCSLHPGMLFSGLQKDLRKITIDRISQDLLVKPLLKIFGKNLEHMVQTTLYCSLIDFDQLQGGKYYSDCKLKEIAREDVKNFENQQRLWQITEKILKLKDANQILQQS